MRGASVLDRLCLAFDEFRGKRGFSAKSADELLLDLGDQASREDVIWLRRFCEIWERHEGDEAFSGPLPGDFTPEEFGLRLDPAPAFEEKAPLDLRCRQRIEADPAEGCNWILWDPEAGGNRGILMQGDDPARILRDFCANTLPPESLRP